jgi:hypothetical protein
LLSVGGRHTFQPPPANEGGSQPENIGHEDERIERQFSRFERRRD